MPVLEAVLDDVPVLGDVLEDVLEVVLVLGDVPSSKKSLEVLVDLICSYHVRLGFITG